MSDLSNDPDFQALAKNIDTDEKAESMQEYLKNQESGESTQKSRRRKTFVKRIQTGVRVEETLYHRAKHTAIDQGVSVSDLFEVAVKEYLDRLENK